MSIYKVNQTEADWEAHIARAAIQHRDRAVSTALKCVLAALVSTGFVGGLVYAMHLADVITSAQIVIGEGIVGGWGGLVLIGAAGRAIWARVSEGAALAHRKSAEKECSAYRVSLTLRELRRKDEYDRYAERYQQDPKDPLVHFSNLVKQGFISEQAKEAIMGYLCLRSGLQEMLNMLQEKEIAVKKLHIAQKFSEILDMFKKGHLAGPRALVPKKESGVAVEQTAV